MDELKQKRISELYQISFTEIHQFRNDTHKLFFGFIGLFTVLLGWVVTKEGAETVLQKACFTGGVLIISFFTPLE